MSDTVMGILTLLASLPLLVWVVVLTVRRGISGAFTALADSMRPAVERVLHGPRPKPTVAETEARIAELERELGIR